MSEQLSNHGALANFAKKLLDEYSREYSDIWSDPVNKNRLSALSDLRLAIELHFRAPPNSESFAYCRQKLLNIIDQCENTFEAPYDSEDGTGQDVFSAYYRDISALNLIDDIKRR